MSLARALDLDDAELIDPRDVAHAMEKGYNVPGFRGLFGNPRPQRLLGFEDLNLRLRERLGKAEQAEEVEGEVVLIFGQCAGCNTSRNGKNPEPARRHLRNPRADLADSGGAALYHHPGPG